MDVELGKLIEKLKAEGVEEGRRMGREKVEAAEKEAAALLQAARSESAAVLLKADKQAADFRAKGETAVRQAARDVQLLLKSRILELFERAFRAEMAEALKPELIHDLILKVADRFSGSEGLDIVLSDRDRAAVEALVRAGLGGELRSGVVLKTDPAVRHGFRVALRGRDVYFDFTDETLTEALFALLKPQLRTLLDGTAE